MSELLERVAEITLRYSMFRPGDRVGVAVSGGVDSVCLLDALLRLAPRFGLRLYVLHFDHRLRGAESDRDAALVAEMAARNGLPFLMESADVRGLAAEAGDNLEQAARRARHGFFQRAMEEHGLNRVATGHTCSDQAETVVYRLLRGSGTAGLSAIRPVTAEGLVRPLLGVERREVEEYAVLHGLRWREDASNRDAALVRNRIRHELLPLLGEYNPRLAPALARMARLAQEDEDYWRAELEPLAARLLSARGETVLAHIGSLPVQPSMRRRLLRLAVEMVRGDPRRIEFGHIDDVMALLRQEEGSGRIAIPGVDVYRSFGWLRLAPAGYDVRRGRDYEFALAVPGECVLPGGTLRVERRRDNVSPEGGSAYNEGETDLDWDRLTAPFLVRNWRPGDQFRPVGRSGQHKVKALFQEAKVPLWDRRHWPVVVAGERIVWVHGFGPDEQMAGTPSSRNLLRISYVPLTE